MKKPINTFFGIIFLILALCTCEGLLEDEKEEEDGAGNGQSSSGESLLPYGKLVINTKQLNNASSLTNQKALPLLDTTTDCTLFGDNITRTEGVCLTPISVGGHVRSIDFGHLENDPLLRGGARAFSEDERTSKRGEILSGGEVDFSTPTKNLVGNNTFKDIYKDPKLTWNYASLSMHFIKIKFLVNSKYVWMLIPSYQQPFSAVENFSKCSSTPSEDVRNRSRYTDADIISDITFKSGDYLFCVKDASTDTCLNTEYKWLDLDSSTLVSTRPTNPKRSSALKKAPDCTVESRDGEDSHDLTPNLIKITGNFPEASHFKLYADDTHGPESNRYPNATTAFNEDLGTAEPDPSRVEPWTQFFQVPSSTGVETVGSNLEIKLEIDTSQMLFVQTMESETLSTETLEDILKNIYTKAMWLNDKVSDLGANSAGLENTLPYINITPTVTVSGDNNPPTSFDSVFSESGQTDDNSSK